MLCDGPRCNAGISLTHSNMSGKYSLLPVMARSDMYIFELVTALIRSGECLCRSDDSMEASDITEALSYVISKYLLFDVP